MSMTKNVAVFVIAGLIVGIVIGYGGAFGVYQPKISELRSQVTEVSSDLTEVTAEFEEYKGYLYTPPAEPVTLKASETGLVIVDMQEACVTKRSRKLETRSGCSIHRYCPLSIALRNFWRQQGI